MCPGGIPNLNCGLSVFHVFQSRPAALIPSQDLSERIDPCKEFDNKAENVIRTHLLGVLRISRKEITLIDPTSIRVIVSVIQIVLMLDLNVDSQIVFDAVNLMSDPFRVHLCKYHWNVSLILHRKKILLIPRLADSYTESVEAEVLNDLAGDNLAIRLIPRFSAQFQRLFNLHSSHITV